MNALHTLARLMLHACVALAPKHRADWSRAMQAEFAAIEAGGPALAWALGCLATAAGWRLRTDGGYLVAFVAAVATSIWFRDHWYVQPNTNWNLHSWDNTMLIAGMALPISVAVAVMQRPRANAGWLLAIAVAVALSVWVHGHWREVMQSSTTQSLPVWVAAMLVLKLALPGSITAAITWRLRADTVYITALVSLILVANWLDLGIWNAFADRSTDQFFSTGQFFTLVNASPYITLALPCLLLCLFRPDRALLTVFVASLINGGLADGIATFILPMLADPFTSKGNHPEVPNVIMALLFSWSMVGAAVTGGAAGWGLGTLGRRFRLAGA